MYNIANCTDEDIYSTNLINRYVILKEECAKSEEEQLVLVTGGFGSYPRKNGDAIYVKEVKSFPKSYKIEKSDDYLLGIARDSVVKKHKELYVR